MLTKPSLLIPVDDLDTAVAFFVSALGAQLKFQDGDRYAALRLQELDIALVGGSERIVEGPALALRSDDIASDVVAMTASGATATTEIETGPHERRAVMNSPASMAVVISQKL
jgi:catechol 2,3-dioxygenase-like lactoylglutathione lyase family enzyme